MYFCMGPVMDINQVQGITPVKKTLKEGCVFWLQGLGCDWVDGFGCGGLYRTVVGFKPALSI